MKAGQLDLQMARTKT